MTDSQKLDLLINAVSGIQGEVAGIKDEITGIKDEITGIKDEVAGIKNQMASFEIEISGIKNEMTDMKNEMATKSDVLKIVSDAKSELYEEIIIAETVLDQLTASQSKINALYLKEDTSAILLKSVDGLENRVTVLEKKIS